MAIEARANLNVVDRIVLVRSTETIPNPSHSVDQWIILIAVDLSADTTNINIDDVRGRVVMKFPHVLQQHGSRNDLSLASNEVFEKLKFTGQQNNAPASATDRSRNEVHLEVADAQ